jgi:predicted transcriptional regulator
MRKVSRLLFELSNEDRLNILHLLKNTPLKLSRVAEKFDCTVPETARNLTRLNEALLIEKRNDGLYYTTPYADEILAIIEGLDFMAENKKYFSTHNPSSIPLQYALSMGILKECTFDQEVTTSIFNIENMLSEAEDFIYFMVDQVLASAVILTNQALKRGVGFKKIMPFSSEERIPPKIRELCNSPFIQQAATHNKAESKYLEKIDIAILMSEKEVGLISFPNLEGSIEYFGFKSSDAGVVDWCKSLFLEYWGNAKPFSSALKQNNL